MMSQQPQQQQQQQPQQQYSASLQPQPQPTTSTAQEEEEEEEFRRLWIGDLQNWMDEEEEEEEYDCAADSDENPKVSVGKVSSSWEDTLKWTSSWEDMLKWRSIARGTRTPEAVYAAHRVYMIGAIFKTRCHNVPATIFEESLDELPLYVEFIDIAKELHSINALDPILGRLYSKNAGIRAKAVKLINTMAKKNHSSRQLLMKASRKGLIYRTYFAEHDPTVQSIALDAISSLFSNDKPGIYADLIDVFENESVNYQRKALNLIARLVEEHNSDYNIVTVLEYPSIMMRLASSVDAEVRKAALKCLVVLARVENSVNSGQVVKNDDKLKQVLLEQIEEISAIDPEDLGDAREEIQLVDSLWNACYNEPCSLRENGLLVLPGEDTPASDVAQAI